MAAADLAALVSPDNGAMTSDPDAPALVRLHAAGRKFARAQAARDKARDELFAAIREAAHVPGVTRTALVDISGVARQTVFDALKQQPAPTDGDTP